MQDTPEFWESRNKGKSAAPIALADNTAPSEAGDVERNRQAGEASQATLKEWCEKYCSDPGLLKAFTVPMQFWGWNNEALSTGEEPSCACKG